MSGVTESHVAGSGEGAAAAPLEEEIIRRATLNYEPMPMLEVIAGRLALSLAGSLKTLTAALAEAKLERFQYLAYRDAMAALPGHGLIAVCHATPWDDSLLISMDAGFLFTALELMLGGRADRVTPRPAGSGFTSIERRMGQRLAELVLKDLAEGIRQVSEVALSVERMEANPAFAMVAQPGSPAVLISLDIGFEGSRGRIDIVIPYDTIDPIRPLLTKVFYGERLGGDDAWRRHLSDRIEDSTVTLTALLHERAFPMADVLGWRVGDTVDLLLSDDQPVTMLCAGQPMFLGAMGKRQNGSAAVRVTEDLNGRKGLKNDLDGD
ncbi:FliM/FliN family flagellar motor switch protein [Acidimangrovimonas sediminis]|uniref:FliM/FliN family flagellar motor switch protein n=1 Tax=Acidimangrovimonas sediminis TaxID=2056283 RepID=UPI000C803CAB|nr:FliM/FliN family flagellar motor switch protein [Acidimangrovimonas sediminis]